MSKRVDEIYEEIEGLFTFQNFLGVPMVFDSEKKRYIHLTESSMLKLLHRNSTIRPRVKASEAREIMDQVKSLAPDLDGNKHLILFGDDYATQKVWNMQTVEWEKVPKDVSHIVWRSSIAPADPEKGSAAIDSVRSFLLDVAKGDERHMNDILQACAPLFTSTKPLGVIWFSGNGRNGKSGVVKLLHLLLGDYLTKITLHQIQDGKLTPALNGHLGNILEESSEGYIDDSEKYKIIGEHGTFIVRKYHSQESIKVDTSMMHTIFNTNNIPNFADKSSGVRARTIIIPFLATFKEDPLFFKNTFTDEFMSAFLHLVTEAAKKIRDQNYNYNWGPITKGEKQDYDDEVNTVEAYIRYLRNKSVTGFTNWRQLRQHYENWCTDNGELPLGLKALKTTFKHVCHVNEKVVRDGETTKRRWTIDKPSDSKIKRSELLDGIGLWVDPKNAEVMKPDPQTVLDIEGLA
jgi:phage/plasmid-associated DNA primase